MQKENKVKTIVYECVWGAWECILLDTCKQAARKQKKVRAVPELHMEQLQMTACALPTCLVNSAREGDWEGNQRAALIKCENQNPQL